MDTKSSIDINKMSVDELSTLDDTKQPEKKKKHPKLKFLIYFLIIIIATGLALFFSLYQDFDGVINAIRRAQVRYLAIILGIVAASYCIDAFVIFVFSRLYTKRYKYHQGAACSMIGAFYSAVTPGSSGGQVMQVYTMKKQGVETSSAASIMIMSFIVYQCALIALGIISLFFSAGELISQIGNFEINFGGNVLRIPAIPLTIAGFLLNLIVIAGLFLMSYSHKFHNFIMHHGINLFAKLHIIKNPEAKRESLRISVENFKIELRRLFSNIPILILVFTCFMLILILRFSIPFFAGLALDGYGFRMNMDGTLITEKVIIDGVEVIQPVMSVGNASIASFWRSVFLSSYHQMTTGLIPLPGSAGISEYFFTLMFGNYYTSPQIVSAAQIIWRFSTFHVVLLVSGIVAATYHSSPKNEIHHADRKTFVTMQYETYQNRKASSDTMFETASLSRQEIQERLKSWGKKKPKERNDYYSDAPSKEVPPVKKVEQPKVTQNKPKKQIFKKKPHKKVEEKKYDTIDFGKDDDL